MSRKALSALLIGQCLVTFTLANAATYHVPTGDTWGQTNLNAGDTLNVEGTILVDDLSPDYWAVGVDPGADDVTINNQGRIYAQGDFKAAIDIAGFTETTVRNEAGAEIVGSDQGIVANGALDLTVRNAGLIYGEWDAGISVSNSENVTITNRGVIFTDLGDGIESVNNVSLEIRNRANGAIGGDTGIYASGESVNIINRGTITGTSGSGVFVEAYAGSGGDAAFLNRNGGMVHGDVYLGAGNSASAVLNINSRISGDLTLESDTVVNLTVGGNGIAALSDLISGSLSINSPEGFFIKRGDGILDVNMALDTTHFAVSGGVANVTNMDGINGQHVLLTDSGNGSALVLSDSAALESFEWLGGALYANASSSATMMDISNAFLMSAGEKSLVLTLDASDLVEHYSLFTFGTGSFDLEDFDVSFADIAGFDFDYVLEQVGNSVVLQLIVDATGSLLQNSTPVGIPTFANFTVAGDVQTGGPSEDNTIRSLSFEDGGNLLVHNTLTVTDGVLTVDSGTGTIDGDTLFAPTYLTKEGEGELVLGSDLFVQVGSDFGVLDGKLTLEGTLLAAGTGYNYGDFVVNGAVITPNGGVVNYGSMVINGETHGLGVFNIGLLGGSGTIYGELYNGGVLNPGNSPGTLTVVGPYVQLPGASLIIEVESESNHDRLWVTGNAHLDGELLIGGDVKFGDKVRFLRAGSITGAFDSISTNDGFRVRLLEKKDSLTALFAPEKYSDVARNDNHRSVAKALDRFIDATGGDRETVSLALDHLRAEEYANAFQQVSPAFHETIGTQAINLTQQQGRLLQQRIGTARYGLRGFRSSTVETTLQTDRDGKSVHSAKDVKEVVTTTTEEGNRWSVWLEGNGVFSRVTQAQQVPNGRTRAGGFVIGTDYAWNPNFIAGLFAGYEGLETKYTDESRVTMNGSRFGGYATYQLDSGLYFDGLVWGGVSEYRSHRNIRFGTIDRTARATQNAGEVSALLGTGYDWKPGNWIMGPTASLQYTYLGIDGFTEDGAKSLNLDMDRQEIHSLRSNLGARIAYRYEVSPDVVIVPELRASWEYEFANDARTMTGQLSGKDISYRTNSQERASLFAGAGVNALFNQRVSASLNYNVDVGRANDTAHIISASFGVQW